MQLLPRDIINNIIIFHICFHFFNICPCPVLVYFSYKCVIGEASKIKTKRRHQNDQCRINMMFLSGYMTLSRCINLYLGKNVCKRGFSLFFRTTKKDKTRKKKLPSKKKKIYRIKPLISLIDTKYQSRLLLALFRNSSRPLIFRWHLRYESSSTCVKNMTLSSVTTVIITVKANEHRY